MALKGHIDVVSRERISGWAWDADAPDTQVSLVISIDGRVVARCLADRPRPDVAAAGLGNGYNGYEYVLPRPLSSTRAHEIGVRREGDGEHLENSPRTLTPSTVLDAPTRQGIEALVAALAGTDAREALAFLAAQTDILRDAVVARRTGAWDRRHRRDLGWQETSGPDPNRQASARADATAMSPVVRVPRALVIDDRMPANGHDAGSDAVLSHMSALRRLGYDVTFVPATLSGDPTALDAAGVATCLHPFYVCVEDVLRRQAGAFQLVYLHRMATAARYAGLARQYQPGARLLYSVADLHFLRTARQAQVESRPELLWLSERQRAAEHAAAMQCDAVLTHSSHEADLLRTLIPQGNVHVVPWAISRQPTPVPFAARRGAAFIAHYAHQPNADAARSLLERIMPSVWVEDASFPCLLAGSHLPAWLDDLADPPAQTLGVVPDLATLFDRVRLTVAPLAFGAGIKGKVLTSFAAGVPCVCTSIAAEGLDLPPPLNELVADDPEAFAFIMLRLERDETFNARCSAAGLDYVDTRLSEPSIDRALRGTLGG